MVKLNVINFFLVPLILRLGLLQRGQHHGDVKGSKKHLESITSERFCRNFKNHISPHCGATKPYNEAMVHVPKVSPKCTQARRQPTNFRGRTLKDPRENQLYHTKLESK